jgi:hypothetical protein
MPPLALRSRQVFDFEPQNVKRVQLRRGEREFAMSRDGAAWSLESPAGAPVDPASSREITNDLARLRARRVVARQERASEFGLSDPELHIRFDVSRPADRDGPPASAPASAPTAGSETHSLLIGRVNDVAYARPEDSPYIYELDSTVYNALTQEIINRQVLDLDPNAVIGLRIESTGGTLDFSKEGENWTYASDPTVQLSQKAVQDFAAELAKLRVERYITYENADIEAAGLGDAPATVTLRLKEGGAVTLRLDQIKRGEVPRLAAWVEQKRVFLLRPGEAERIMRGLDEYLKKEAPPEETPAGFPGQPGQPPRRPGGGG